MASEPSWAPLTLAGHRAWPVHLRRGSLSCSTGRSAGTRGNRWKQIIFCRAGARRLLAWILAPCQLERGCCLPLCPRCSVTHSQGPAGAGTTAAFHLCLCRRRRAAQPSSAVTLSWSQVKCPDANTFTGRVRRGRGRPVCGMWSWGGNTALLSPPWSAALRAVIRDGRQT